MNFKKEAKPQNSDKKQRKKDILKNLYILFEGREIILNTFDSRIFPAKIEGRGFFKHLWLF